MRIRHLRVAMTLFAAVALVVSATTASLESPAGADAPAFASDDFNRLALGAPWTVEDPAGDGTVAMTGAGTADAHVTLTVPAVIILTQDVTALVHHLK